MKIGLFVEGKSDKRTLPILIEKIFERKAPKPGLEIRTIPQGDMLSVPKMEVYLKKDLLVKHPDLRKIVVCLDCECTPPEKIRSLMLPVEKKLGALFRGVQTKYCLVVHALEGWLASDEKALAEYLGQPRLKISWNPKQVCRPRENLKDTFKRANREFDHLEDDPEIAKRINIDTLTKRNPSFAAFRHLVTGGEKKDRG